jgi:diketogulonate reductase-like aldo/keto reductase
VNQVEFHPFLFEKDLLMFCKHNRIQLDAYSPLTRAKKLEHPKVAEMNQIPENNQVFDFQINLKI